MTQVPDAISLEGVSFSYSGSVKPSLIEVSLSIPSGATVAIVGRNGSGKSTLLKLICGLYQPTQGTIRLFGRRLSDLTNQDIWNTVSIMFQDPPRYELPLRDGVGFGKLSHIRDDEYLMMCIEKAGLKTSKFGDRGLDARLGKRFSGGLELSGGEWQKLALARTFARDAKLVLLNEPTANIDPLSEQTFYDHMTDLMIGKTSLVVSHRFNTVRHADMILVMDEGRLVESGSHDELMSKEGLYQRMFTAQRSRFMD